MTFRLFLELVELFRLVTDVYPDHRLSNKGTREWDETNLSQPAFERYLAYIIPMAPIPMIPMTGCSSMGEEGSTTARVSEAIWAKDCGGSYESRESLWKAFVCACDRAEAPISRGDFDFKLAAGSSVEGSSVDVEVEYIRKAPTHHTIHARVDDNMHDVFRSGDVLGGCD